MKKLLVLSLFCAFQVAHLHGAIRLQPAEQKALTQIRDIASSHLEGKAVEKQRNELIEALVSFFNGEQQFIQPTLSSQYATQIYEIVFRVFNNMNPSSQSDFAQNVLGSIILPYLKGATGGTSPIISQQQSKRTMRRVLK